MYLGKSVFMVVGISRSGVAATEFLLSKGAKCYIFDELNSEGISASMDMLEKKGAVKVPADQAEALKRRFRS